MKPNLLPYQTESIFENPIEGLELDRWVRLINNLAKLSAAPVVMINHAFERGVEVLASNIHPDNPYKAGAEVPLDCNIYCHHVIQSSEPLLVTDASQGDDWDDNPEYTQDGFGAYAGVPLEWPDGRVFGTLCVLDSDAEKSYANYLSLLNDFKEIIDFELKLLDQNRRLRALSVIDEMTGLYNRRGINSASKQLLGLADRYGRKIAAIFLDLDNLKPINDNYGHDAGDEAIKSAARVINGCIRDHDIAARMGGDEFVMLCLLELDDDPRTIVQRLEIAVQSTSISLPSQEQWPLSVSIGCAVGQPMCTEDLEALIKSADDSMYRSKEARKA